MILDLWFKPEGWDEKPIILVTFRALKEKLGLPLETDKKLFTYKELIGQPALLDLLDEAQKVRATGDPDKLTNLEKEAEHLGERLQMFQDCVNGQKQTIVPHPTLAEGRWLPIQNLGTLGVKIWPPVEAVAPSYKTDDAAAQKAGAQFMLWYQSWRNGDLAQFNLLTPQVVESLRALSPAIYPAAGSLQFEHHYMTLHPFRWAWIIYLLTLIVLLLTAIWGRTWGYRLTWIGVLSGLGMEIYGLACRVIISGRPPVTNMYETVIWVSFGAMLFAVILESVYRRRYFFYAGLGASILTLIVADSQPTILDASINPLTAVLRNNMWLTIHVLTIVSSYAAFALTAALGHIALTMSLWGKRYATAQTEVQFFIYRAMQIGVLLLAAGDDPRRGLGELFVGPLLGLGPEGDVGTGDAALLYRVAAWTARGLVGRLRAGGRLGGLLPLGDDVVVRRELRSRQGTPQLWLRHGRVQLCRGVRRLRGAFRGVRSGVEPTEADNAGTGVRSVGSRRPPGDGGHCVFKVIPLAERAHHSRPVARRSTATFSSSRIHPNRFASRRGFIKLAP